MSKDINEVIKDEIKAAHVRALVELKETKQKYEEAKKHVQKLEKSLKCEHSFDNGSSGFLPIGWDDCSKCGWSHVY